MNSKIPIILVLALVSISTSSIFARLLPEVPAIIISFWRLAIASALILLYTFIKPQPKIKPSDYVLYILAGIALSLHFVFFYAAIKHTSIANATLLIITVPMFTLLFEKFILKNKLKPILLVGLVIILCGTFIITLSDLISSENSLIGKIYAIAAALFIAIVYFFAIKLRVRTNTIVYTKYLYGFASIFLLILTIIFNKNIFYNVNSDNFIWLVLLGIIPTILGHSILYYSIKFISPSVVASVPLGEPVIASFLAWLIFSEKILLSTFLGGTVIFFGLYLVITKSSKRYYS